MEKEENFQKHFSYRWTLLIIALILISICICITIVIIQVKHNSEVFDLSTSDAIIVENKYNMSIQGLLTTHTAVNANVCHENETLEDCVLVHNARIFMNALSLMPSSTFNNSTISFNFPNKSTMNTTDCKRLRIRRNDLSQIFDPLTLTTIYNISDVPYSLVDNSKSSDQVQARSQIDGRSVRNRWSTSINYYVSQTTGFTPTMIANIHTAISFWENNTCLKFNELSVITSATNKSFILFQRDDEYGCSSPVGYDVTDPTSVIFLALYCGSIVGSIIHEIGHTLGYIHTQSRIDRNSFVSIVTSNIQQDYAGNFFIWTVGTIQFSDVTFPYDYGSLMHYDSFAFSQNGLPTIIALDSRYQKTMGQRQSAAFHDYKQINRLYCTRTDCPQMFNNNTCQNNGYLDPKTCSKCICPEGLGGANCNERDPDSTCGNIIVNPTPYSSTQITIENPSPSSAISTQQYCVYLIRSISPRKIRLRLDSINTKERLVCLLSSLIEVKYRNDLGVTGARWCGTNITSDWLNVTAESNTMLVIFRANNSIDQTTGTAEASFRATIFFDAEPLPLSQTPTILSTTPILTTSSTSTSITTTTTITTSTCPEPSFRCRLQSQPTCGGCLNLQPCTIQGTQQCIAYSYQPQIIDCNKIVNGIAQCRYLFVQISYTTTCQRTVLLCCPNYQLISIQSYYFCVYNPQINNIPNQWSLIL